MADYNLVFCLAISTSYPVFDLLMIFIKFLSVYVLKKANAYVGFRAHVKIAYRIVMLKL